MSSLSLAGRTAGDRHSSMLGSWLNRLAKAIADRRALIQLHNLDDRMLADIGLTRDAIDDAVRGRLTR